MNPQLIEKVIKSDDGSCPEFKYKSPLLDKTVSQALSKSFVKILANKSGNSNVDKSLRRAVLENIRKICTSQPENHHKVGDYFTELVTEFYKNKLENNSDCNSSVDKMLDEFIIRNSLEQEIPSQFETSTSPEVLQALMNLDEEGIKIIAKEIIHFNTKNEKYHFVLQHLWKNNLHNGNIDGDGINNICIKMKPAIEGILLSACLNFLEDRYYNIEDIFAEETFQNLIKTCAMSNICFQICMNTLNSLLLSSRFDCQVLHFIPKFVWNVKNYCPYISTLYPYTLSDAVLLCDIELNEMPVDVKEAYIKHALESIKNVHNESEYDLIILLTHYPQWFDIYFKEDNVVIDQETSHKDSKDVNSTN